MNKKGANKIVILVIVTILLTLAIFFTFNRYRDVDYRVNQDFQISKVSSKKTDKINKALSLRLLSEEVKLNGIKKFDVSTDGLIALSSEKFSTDKVVNVYDDSGKFQYGYKFFIDGDYYIKWKNSTLGIYSVRSKAITYVDSKGDYIGFGEVKDNEFNSNIFYELDQPKRVIGDKTYVLSKDIGIFGLLSNGYSQVVINYEDGKNQVIYDEPENLILSIVFDVFVPLLFFGTCTFFAIRYFIKNKGFVK